MAEFEINITIEHHDAFADDTVTAFAKTINEIAHLLFHNVHTTWNPIAPHDPVPPTPVDDETKSAVNDAGFQVKGTRTGRLYGDPNFRDER